MKKNTAADSPWSVKHGQTEYHCPIFSIEKLTAHHERMNLDHNFFILNHGVWVNILPFDTEGKVVLVKQFRFGSRENTLEIPGGLAEPGENPEFAALREMEEETGYRAGSVHFLGKIHPNPATHNNWCYAFAAFGCTLVTEQNLDQAEDIEIITLPFPEVLEKIISGEIYHSLVLNAFLLHQLKFPIQKQ